MLALQKPTVHTVRTVQDKLTVANSDAYCLLPCTMCHDYTPVSMEAVCTVPLDKLSIICYDCYYDIIQDNIKTEVSNYE